MSRPPRELQPAPPRPVLQPLPQASEGEHIFDTAPDTVLQHLGAEESDESENKSETDEIPAHAHWLPGLEAILFDGKRVNTPYVQPRHLLAN
jgi:hypothetical protein